MAIFTIGDKKAKEAYERALAALDAAPLSRSEKEEAKKVLDALRKKGDIYRLRRARGILTDIGEDYAMLMKLRKNPWSVLTGLASGFGVGIGFAAGQGIWKKTIGKEDNPMAMEVLPNQGTPITPLVGGGRRGRRRKKYFPEVGTIYTGTTYFVKPKYRKALGADYVTVVDFLPDPVKKGWLFGIGREPGKVEVTAPSLGGQRVVVPVNWLQKEPVTGRMSNPSAYNRFVAHEMAKAKAAGRVKTFADGTRELKRIARLWRQRNPIGEADLYGMGYAVNMMHDEAECPQCGAMLIVWGTGPCVCPSCGEELEAHA
jgi:hypothetical protein